VIKRRVGLQYRTLRGVHEVHALWTREKRDGIGIGGPESRVHAKTSSILTPNPGGPVGALRNAVVEHRSCTLTASLRSLSA
jgi:hypothetical protein